MKVILISIKPKYVADILNGKKTIEIRKKFPKDYVGWVYIYVTRDRKILSFDSISKNGKTYYDGFNDKDFDFHFFTIAKSDIKKGWGWFASERNLNGKVVARFWCDKVENIKWHKDTAIDLDYYKVVNVIENKEILKASCLQLKELEDYLQIKNAKNIPTTWGITFNLGYAIHITEVKPFDKPKELFDFKVLNNKYECDMCPFYIKDGIDDCLYSHHPKCLIPLTRAPQSFMFIEV